MCNILLLGFLILICLPNVRNQGFQCVGCPKLFPPTPGPQPSAAPGRRRSVRAGWKQTFERRKLSFQQIREAQEKGNPAKPIRIRGRWVTQGTSYGGQVFVPLMHLLELRQLGSPSGAVDGSQGVDSEDITNIPQIGFSTSAFFPDQFKYGADNPNLTPYENTVQQGVDWINRQAAVGASYVLRFFRYVQTITSFCSSGKPVLMDAFGLVTTPNVPAYVPFDSATQPPSLPPSLGVTDTQRDNAYATWFQGTP